MAAVLGRLSAARSRALRALVPLAAGACAIGGVFIARVLIAGVELMQPRAGSLSPTEAARLDRSCPLYAFDEHCPDEWHAASASERAELRAAEWPNDWDDVTAAEARRSLQETGLPVSPKPSPRALCIANLRPQRPSRALNCCPAQAIDRNRHVVRYAPPRLEPCF